jgi:ABC-type bacteriocin/lantibiotic exporter with double-glycine peptidase domain
MPRKSSESDSPDAPPKVKVTRESFGQMLSLYTYLRPYRGRLYVGLFMLIASTLLGLFFPLLVKVMINSKTHAEAFDTAVLMVGILLVQGVMS